MGEISDLVKMGPVSRVKQQISADLGTFLDGQTLKAYLYWSISASGKPNLTDFVAS